MLNMENIEKELNKEKIYCIFNQTKENANKKIEKAFKIYLKDYINIKNNIENNQKLY